ncbi:STAS domain-containing protein [Anaeromyxobacter oryzae]|uniref:STAS domain-containing protein n=1 Tax=Anaeromyxobacter oryzae TaxID=2918170 RepID=A0ABN6MS07_9BACT|nr:STAS domain-containing protein [Anaeromyxobacter oryzae]BDG03755.1 hypothetical protein AMOR_27510 [Anaeromyxobacter oryzae]
MIATTTAGPRVIRMDGVFDVPAAEALARVIAEAGEGVEVAIDLTHVREFHDFGVTVLARALASRGARVAVRGLRQHHLRLLRYLGIETGAAQLDRPIEAA